MGSFPGLHEYLPSAGGVCRVNNAGVYRAIAQGDLVLFTVLAIPVLGEFVLNALLAINTALAWPGSLELVPPVVLLVHLLGLMGAGFAASRLVSGATVSTVRLTMAIKFLAVGLFAMFVVQGAPAILLAIALVDLIQGGLLLRVRGRA